MPNGSKPSYNRLLGDGDKQEQGSEKARFCDHFLHENERFHVEIDVFSSSAKSITDEIAGNLFILRDKSEKPKNKKDPHPTLSQRERA